MIFVQVHAPDLSVGDPVPDISFRRVDGSELAMRSLRGHIVVLEFTSLHCPPCRAIAPQLEDLADKNPDVVFLTVSQDPPDVLPKLAALRRRNARTILLQDVSASDRSKRAKVRFGDVAVPNMYVIDRQGRMASRCIMGDGTANLSRLEYRIAWARKHVNE